MDGQPEGRRELPVEMIFGVGRNTAQQIQVQIVMEMLIDVIAYPLHSRLMFLNRRCHYRYHVFRSSASFAFDGTTYSTNLAVLIASI